MNVWKTSVVEGYEWAMGIEEHDRTALTDIFRRRSSKSWPEARVKLLREDEGQHFKEADFPWYSSTVIVLRSRVMPVIQEILLKHGELVPLVCDEAELFGYNCTTVLDALDHSLARMKYFSSSGRFWRVDRHVFVPERLKGINLFRLPEYENGGPIYVSDAFRQLVFDSGLTGLGFKLVWSTDDSETASIAQQG